MASSRAIYLQKRYKERYGSIGVVAGRYLEAGYSVEIMHPTRYGPIHIIARGNNRIMAIEVIDKHEKVSIDDVQRLINKSKLVNAKPILILYSDGPTISDDVYTFCRENGVKVRRMRVGKQ